LEEITKNENRLGRGQKKLNSDIPAQGRSQSRQEGYQVYLGKKALVCGASTRR